MRLETERLLLRLPEPTDVDAFAPFFADPEVVRYTGGKTRTRRETGEILRRMGEHWDRHGCGLFVVVQKEDERPIGRVGILIWDGDSWTHALARAPRGRVEHEIGWTFGRAYWGQGFATEAAVTVRDWALDGLGLPRLISLIQQGNDASVRVALKLGEALERENMPGPFVGATDLYSLAPAGNGPAR
ncbi:MAG: GNAT family N-acetyltransferase [Gaiellaceae bacterium]